MSTAAFPGHDTHDRSGRAARPTSWRRFVRHQVVMVVAMYTGMLGPVYAAVATRAGYADPWSELPVVSALVMAFNMTVPMVLLMLHHRRGVLPTVEMAASMIAPTAAAVLHVVGVLRADQVMTVAHLAMFPAMLLVMLLRLGSNGAARSDRRSRRANVPEFGHAHPRSRLVDFVETRRRPETSSGGTARAPKGES